MTRHRARWLLLAICLAAAPSRAALHLLFPYDYLALSDDERHQYVIGVLDARLAPLEPTDRLEWLTRCLTSVGATHIRHVLETRIIPIPGMAGIPMPYVVERALRDVCPKAPRAAQ